MPQWLIMQAPDVPWGSVTNIDKIDNVRLIPKLDEDGKATGEVQVHISTEMSQQAFTYPDLPTAQGEYFRISNEIRGTALPGLGGRGPLLEPLPPGAEQRGQGQEP